MTTIRDDEVEIDKDERLPPVHPGEVLLEEFLRPLGLSRNRVALSMGVPPRRINEIVLCRRSVTADTALRLARYFGTSPRFWMSLQSSYDLDVAEDVLGKRLEREVPPLLPKTPGFTPELRLRSRPSPAGNGV